MLQAGEYYLHGCVEIFVRACVFVIYKGIDISKELNAEIVEKDIWIEVGDKVNDFEGANDAIGTLVLKFTSEEELKLAMDSQNKWLKIIIE